MTLFASLRAKRIPSCSDMHRRTSLCPVYPRWLGLIGPYQTLPVLQVSHAVHNMAERGAQLVQALLRLAYRSAAFPTNMSHRSTPMDHRICTAPQLPPRFHRPCTIQIVVLSAPEPRKPARPPVSTFLTLWVLSAWKLSSIMPWETIKLAHPVSEHVSTVATGVAASGAPSPRTMSTELGVSSMTLMPRILSAASR
jgi:hypothetical protein